jgi:hypothetical protein
MSRAGATLPARRGSKPVQRPEQARRELRERSVVGVDRVVERGARERDAQVGVVQLAQQRGDVVVLAQRGLLVDEGEQPLDRRRQRRVGLRATRSAAACACACASTTASSARASATSGARSACTSRGSASPRRRSCSSIWPQAVWIAWRSATSRL